MAIPFQNMPGLHFRWMIGERNDPRLSGLLTTLTAAGHLVTRTDQDPVPVGYAVVPDLLITETGDLSGDLSLEAAELRHIRMVLEQNHGNRRQTALNLGIARSTLLARLRRLEQLMEAGKG